MGAVRVFNSKEVVLRGASGNLTAGEITSAVDTEGFATAVVMLSVTELVMAAP